MVMYMFRFAEEEGRINITLQATIMGKDLCVVITGGERPHLGAVALGLVRFSLSDSSKNSASVSVLTVPGHKEDELARSIAQKITSKLGINTVVSCGIHVDNITITEINMVSRLTDKLSDKLIKTLA